jgi:hypothetical protein
MYIKKIVLDKNGIVIIIVYRGALQNFGAFSNTSSYIQIFYSIFRAVDLLHVVVSGKLQFIASQGKACAHDWSFI